MKKIIIHRDNLNDNINKFYGYDFKLQPVVRLQIGRSGVVRNVELSLNYHCSQVHSYPEW